MNRAIALGLLLCLPSAVRAETLCSGLKNPESVAVGGDGKVYVTTIGEFNQDGDGAVLVLEDGEAQPLAEGLNDPKHHDRIVRAFEENIPKAAAEGVPNVICFFGNRVPGMSDQEAIDHSIACLNRCKPIAGTPADCIAAIEEYREAGCTHVMLELWGDRRHEQIRLFGEKVLPHVRD